MSKYAAIWDKKTDLVSEQDRNTPWFKIMEWLSGDQKVLDVGCSSGYFGEKLMSTLGCKVWGVELDPNDATLARKRGYQEVFEGDLDSFNWAQLDKLKFDAIIFADVLEHLKDPVACLKSAQKFLSKNGIIYSSIPNIANITVRAELMEGNFDYEPTGLLDNTHIRFFTKKTVYKTFAEAGLEIVDINATTNDYSEGQIKSLLTELGLAPTDKFDRLLASPEAQTFQFIIKAVRSNGKAKLPPEYTLGTKLHDKWPAIAKKMEDDDRRIKDLEQQNKSLEADLEAAKNELTTIHEHPIHWATKKITRKVTRHGRIKKS